MKKLGNKIKDTIQAAKIAAGILDKRIYTGPWTVQIDLNNSCNNNCIGCWCHSPLLEELAMDEETKKKKISYEKAMKLIDDLDKMGVRDIYFTGGGEPFMHPRAIEIIENVKKKGIRCDMSTNFTLITKDIAKRLVKSGMDNINCSIWAGSPEAYVKTHPNKTKETFYRVQEMFNYLNHLKKRYKTKKPSIYIYNVISNRNYDDFENMVEFAFKIKADGVDFTPTDIVPGKTDSLMLSKKQSQELSQKVKEIFQKIKVWEKIYGHKIEFKNHSQFLRRIESNETEKGKYDESIIGKIPCYAGWTFLRILADGTVVPCLKAIRIPVGNLNEKSIKKIWFSREIIEFRKNTINYNITNPYFNRIGNEYQKVENGCVLCCDNLGLNLLVHGELEKLGSLRKNALRLVKYLK